MAGRIVSLRENIELLDRQDNRMQQAGRIFAGAVGSVERHIFRLYPDKLQAEPPSLTRETELVLQHPEVSNMEGLGRRLEQELTCTENLIRTRLAGTVELGDVLMLLAATTQSIQNGTAKREQGLATVSGELERAAELHSVEEFRAQVRAQILTLSQHINEMREENRLLLQDLEKEMHAFRKQLDRASVEANLDPLTGLGNRRTLEMRLEELIGSHISFCLLLVDFNRFKQINDQFGHLAGDELLRAFAGRLLHQIREDDTAVRWGGDEFIVLLPVKLSDAMVRAQVMERQLSGDYRLTVCDRTVRVQLGLTMAVSEYKKGESADQVITRADTLLYAGKASRA